MQKVETVCSMRHNSMPRFMIYLEPKTKIIVCMLLYLTLQRHLIGFVMHFLWTSFLKLTPTDKYILRQTRNFLLNRSQCGISNKQKSKSLLPLRMYLWALFLGLYYFWSLSMTHHKNYTARLPCLLTILPCTRLLNARTIFSNSSRTWLLLASRQTKEEWISLLKKSKSCFPTVILFILSNIQSNLSICIIIIMIIINYYYQNIIINYYSQQSKQF